MIQRSKIPTPRFVDHLMRFQFKVTGSLMTNHLQQVVIDDMPAKLDILGEFIAALNLNWLTLIVV
jgi:hypothetical protein